MANDKEIIRKLLKIAENQQKIITKLAQDMGGEHSSPDMAPMGDSGASPMSGKGDSNEKAAAVLKANFSKIKNLNLKNVSVTGMETSNPKVEVAADGPGATPSNVTGMSIEYFLYQMKAPDISLNGKPVMVKGKSA
jgi:hypothetical protein